ncbi:hypothetical protein K1J10_10625, partial [Streptococcus australis]|uniref:hypothetical protein n=1 Tax=Streptococcus australis TaxID=113107 RepID=UPI001CBE23E1
YAVFRNSSISDERVFCVALHFTTGQSILISNGISIDEIEKIMSFLNDKDTISLHSLLECSKLRIFRKLHKDKATTFQLNDSEIKQFADFIKNIDIRSCFPGRDPNLIGENFTDRLDCYLNNNLNSINSTLYNQIQDFFNSNATDISYPKTLIEYFRYFFKGKDSIKFISDFLLNENLPNCQVKCNKVIPLIKRVFFQLFELA